LDAIDFDAGELHRGIVPKNRPYNFNGTLQSLQVDIAGYW
jgi:hypothetical protein